MADLDTRPAIGDCPYVSLAAYSWHDVSCNMFVWNVHIPWNPAVYCIIASLHALAWWISAGLFVQTLTFFKKKNTLYFWSMMAVTIGITLETLAYTGRIFFEPITKAGIIYYTTLTWPSLIATRTGFGLVMYSRLYVIQQSPRFQRACLWLVIVVAVVGHSGMLAYSACGYAERYDVLQKIYNVWIYVEVVFTMQDVVLASLYLWYFWGYMRDVPSHLRPRMQRQCRDIFALLVLAHVWVVLADCSQYALLCRRLYLARMMVLPALEAIKLKIEFFVLNKLVEVGQMKQQLLGRQSLGSSLLGAPGLSVGTRSTMSTVAPVRPGMPLMRESTGQMTEGTLVEIVSAGGETSPELDPGKKV